MLPVHHLWGRFCSLELSTGPSRAETPYQGWEGAGSTEQLWEPGPGHCPLCCCPQDIWLPLGVPSKSGRCGASGRGQRGAERGSRNREQELWEKTALRQEWE